MNPRAGGWLILLSLIGAMLLAIVHLPASFPDWLGLLRPVWVAVVLFYWVIEVPHRIGLIAAWSIGLLVDVLQGDPLGLNGALLASITYVGWRFHARLGMYAPLQQGGVLALLLLGTEALRMLLLALLAGHGIGWDFIGPAFASLIAWPFAALVLDLLRRRITVR